MKYTIKTVNENGIQQIKAFLEANSKRGGLYTDANIRAWANDAEFQLREGNSPSIELESGYSVYGRTQEYTITDEGLDSEDVEIKD